MTALGMTEDDRLVFMVCHPERSEAEPRDLGFCAARNQKNSLCFFFFFLLDETF